MSEDVRKAWVPGSNGQIPENAFEAGYDGSEIMYIGRAPHAGDVIPGKVHPSHKVCYICWGNEEHAKDSYEVLCKSDLIQFEWLPSANGELPAGAIVGGKRSDGGKYFIGRAKHENCLVPGKIHPENECIYVPWGGKENRYDAYEALAAKVIDLP
ncbi:DgyrCDS1711 [Dimorphilus gyrociliatus]|uniref:DgyrCDS1711 n=1 Tax=Dimorphilus gyrociliatus TaxID=2664684 RepID=A0A7I8V9L0_9ANNE|nr:DgyrCDS1711 [Dimorphilus gyrociliatus]